MRSCFFRLAWGTSSGGGGGGGGGAGGYGGGGGGGGGYGGQQDQMYEGVREEENTILESFFLSTTSAILCISNKLICKPRPTLNEWLTRFTRWVLIRIPNLHGNTVGKDFSLHKEKELLNSFVWFLCFLCFFYFYFSIRGYRSGAAQCCKH